jgi:hypothetical protein
MYKILIIILILIILIFLLYSFIKKQQGGSYRVQYDFNDINMTKKLKNETFNNIELNKFFNDII